MPHNKSITGLPTIRDVAKQLGFNYGQIFIYLTKKTDYAYLATGKPYIRKRGEGGPRFKPPLTVKPEGIEYLKSISHTLIQNRRLRHLKNGTKLEPILNNDNKERQMNIDLEMDEQSKKNTLLEAIEKEGYDPFVEVSGALTFFLGKFRRFSREIQGRLDNLEKRLVDIEENQGKESTILAKKIGSSLEQREKLKELLVEIASNSSWTYLDLIRGINNELELGWKTIDNNNANNVLVEMSYNQAEKAFFYLQNIPY